jgi:hypothetical protein
MGSIIKLFFYLLSTSQSAGAMTKAVKPPLPVEVYCLTLTPNNF